jgi:hypothetical protein
VGAFDAVPVDDFEDPLGGWNQFLQPALIAVEKFFKWKDTGIKGASSGGRLAWAKPRRARVVIVVNHAAPRRRHS